MTIDKIPSVYVLIFMKFRSFFQTDKHATGRKAGCPSNLFIPLLDCLSP